MSEALASSPAPWWQRRMASVDLETTSPDPETARIVQACVVHVGGGVPVVSRPWLIDPGVDIPEEATAIHKITTAMVRERGLPADKAVAQIVAELQVSIAAGEPLCIFNSPYDLTLLARECVRLGLVVEEQPNALVIDPLVLDKHLDPYRKGKRNLTSMCAHYSARIDGAHDAAHDALAAARVAFRIGQRFPQLGNMDLRALHDLQRRAYWEQAQSLNQHWIKKGDSRRVTNYSWPVQPPKAAP